MYPNRHHRPLHWALTIAHHRQVPVRVGAVFIHPRTVTLEVTKPLCHHLVTQANRIRRMAHSQSNQARSLFLWPMYLIRCDADPKLNKKHRSKMRTDHMPTALALVSPPYVSTGVVSSNEQV